MALSSYYAMGVQGLEYYSNGWAYLAARRRALRYVDRQSFLDSRLSTFQWEERSRGMSLVDRVGTKLHNNQINVFLTYSKPCSP